ncbi:pentapeptide repeat-containing protein [Streptomyces sp. NPDC055055]
MTTPTPRRRAERRGLRLWNVGLVLVLAFTAAVLTAGFVFYTGWDLLGARELQQQPKIDSKTLFDLVKLSFGVVAGAGALVALVVAYRRQRVDEDGALRDATRLHTERFTTAVSQLGDDSAAVRLGGVHALAGLADDAPTRELRQTCVDVLCAYLRLPYAAEADLPVGDTAARHAYLSLREVRHTVIRLVRDHLRLSDQPHSWGGLHLDFTGVVFDGGDFSNAEFAGGTVDLSQAVFSGGRVDFTGTRFRGGTVDFTGVHVSGGTVDFTGAVFSAGVVDLTRARFSGGLTDFTGVTFSGGLTDFSKVKFAGGMVLFNEARFSGGAVDFSEAGFSGDLVSFAESAFSSGTVRFTRAKFSGGTVDFLHAAFLGADVDFAGTTFSAGTVSFAEARFFGGDVAFTLARFFGGTVDFTGVQFSGGVVDFTEASFSRGRVGFTGAVFSSGTVGFTRARLSGATVDFDRASGRCPIDLPRSRPVPGLTLPDVWRTAGSP